MEEERGKRRRGRRRGKQEYQESKPEPQRAEPEPQPGDLEITEESAAPGIMPFRLRFGRRAGGRTDKERARRAERTAAGGGPNVSPMDFWRSAQARSHRERPLPRQGPTRLLARLTGFYFPPWVPVVAIILIVFGILAVLFLTRSATGAPRVGDHWHATYTYTVCGEKQPAFPTWESGGVHTHGDGIIHSHPFSAAYEGPGARLVKWFGYGGGKLTSDTVRAPGSNKEHKNGDQCPDGSTGVVQVFVNSQKMDDFSRYISRDGDRVRIVFGPPEEVTQLADRQILPEAAATRTVNIEVTGDDAASPPVPTKFTPSSIQVNAGETVKLVLKNVGTASHGLRVRGVDGQYGTGDDFVVTPLGSAGGADQGEILGPAQEGSTVIRFDTGGNVEFHDPTTISATGTIIVRDVAASATPAPTGEALEPVDTTLDVTMVDSAYQPKQLTVQAGQKFRINLKNDGTFVHNLRIAGPDGQYYSDDDIVSRDLLKGESGNLVGQLDNPGTYSFQDDFHPTEMMGTVTVQ